MLLQDVPHSWTARNTTVKDVATGTQFFVLLASHVVYDYMLLGWKKQFPGGRGGLEMPLCPGPKLSAPDRRHEAVHTTSWEPKARKLNSKSD